MVGATPVFLDINRRTFDINADLIPAAATPRIKAILPAQVYGRPADIEPIHAIAECHEVKALKDCAQAFGPIYRGKKVGILGRAGTLSCCPSKNFGAYGDGSLLVTDDGVARRTRILSVHGFKRRY